MQAVEAAAPTKKKRKAANQTGAAKAAKMETPPVDAPPTAPPIPPLQKTKGATGGMLAGRHRLDGGSVPVLEYILCGPGGLVVMPIFLNIF